MTDFGFFLSGEEMAPKALVDYAVAAEAAGFRKLWVSDHFHPWLSVQDESPFIWSVLGAIAATTELELTTAVTCPTYRIHPAILAQATATMACLAPGRFSFGVGSGEVLNEHIFGDTWPPVSLRQERLEEAIELIRMLWAGDLITHEGKHFQVYNAKVHSLPDTPPPILVSAFGAQASELAARAGDGLIAIEPDPDLIAKYREAGGTGVIQGGVKICWAETEKEGVETARTMWGHEAIGGALLTDIPLWTGFEALRDATTPEVVADAVPCGPDAAKAAEAISAYVKAGFDEVYISQMGPDQLGGIRFITDEVLPLL